MKGVPLLHFDRQDTMVTFYVLIALIFYAGIGFAAEPPAKSRVEHIAALLISFLWPLAILAALLTHVYAEITGRAGPRS